MSINILTWWNVLNYGSVFQAYALQELIKNIKKDVQILTHDRIISSTFDNKLESLTIKGCLKWLRNMTPRRIQFRSSSKQKKYLFDKFYEENLDIVSKQYELNDDILLIGSDQIFDIKSFFYPWQFGGMFNCKKITTYAPSFGETDWNILEKHPAFNYIAQCIKNMDHVNARDNNTASIMGKILNCSVPIVLDPVLLYGFNHEKSMSDWNYKLIDKPYCIIYSWGGFTTLKSFAIECKSFAKKHGLKLVSVGEPRPWCDIQMDSASPIDFFSLFMHANMVLTNMFHGTCFSIIMERPFYSFVMPHNMNKLGGLLKELNLESQIIYTPDLLNQKQLPNVDYSILNKILIEKRNDSLNELENSII